MRLRKPFPQIPKEKKPPISTLFFLIIHCITITAQLNCVYAYLCVLWGLNNLGWTKIPFVDKSRIIQYISDIQEVLAPTTTHILSCFITNPIINDILGQGQLLFRIAIIYKNNNNLKNIVLHQHLILSVIDTNQTLVFLYWRFLLRLLFFWPCHCISLHFSKCYSQIDLAWEYISVLKVVLVLTLVSVQ